MVFRILMGLPIRAFSFIGDGGSGEWGSGGPQGWRVCTLWGRASARGGRPIVCGEGWTRPSFRGGRPWGRHYHPPRLMTRGHRRADYASRSSVVEPPPWRCFRQSVVVLMLAEFSSKAAGVVTSGGGGPRTAGGKRGRIGRSPFPAADDSNYVSAGRVSKSGGRGGRRRGYLIISPTRRLCGRVSGARVLGGAGTGGCPVRRAAGLAPFKILSTK